MKLAFYYLVLALLVLQSHFVTAQQQLPTDCSGAVTACGNSDINLNVSGYGTQELIGSNTCSSEENNSVWLKVTLVTDGTLGFTLTPNSSSIEEDYDFFVFGPNATCGNLGQAIRCSTTNPKDAGQGNNLTGMNSSATDTAEGPGRDGDSFVKWLDVKAGDSYFIVIDRPIGNSAFSLQWTGTAKFSDPPSDHSQTSGTPLDLEKCDATPPFRDGLTEFNLTDNTNLIKGLQTDVAITYHETASDANIGINPLSSPYTNSSNQQTIYARITNTKTGCFELTDFKLKVNLGPNFNPPSDYKLCDDATDGDQTNGRVTFNLSSKNNEILNGQDPATVNISYHISQSDAETKANPLPDSYYNNTPINEQIFVRIEEALNPNCKSVTALNLIVNPLPTVNNVTITQCDDDGSLDEKTRFNINQVFNDISSSNNISISYYTTRLNAESGTNPINGDDYQNISNPQTVYARVSFNETQCYEIAEVTLEISTTNINNAILTACDTDGNEDGFFEFTLSDTDSNVLNGITQPLSIAYYETYEEALLETNVLDHLYTNTSAYHQTIYARAENANNCYGISEVALVVQPLPNIKAEETTYYCLNVSPQPITISSGILKDQSNYTYLWSTGASTPEIAVTEPGSYTVTVTTKATNCAKEKTITVLPSNIATIDKVEVVDATANNTVTIIVSGHGDYEFALGPDINFQDTNVFENVKPGIYTGYVKDKRDCGIADVQISVIGFPKFFTPNGDGYNDYWQVIGLSQQFQPETIVYIYDRYGKLLKQLSPVENGWDGTFNGQPLPATDYWFTVTLEDGRIYNGHFSLKR